MKKPTRIVAVDFGSARIGLALSDEMKIIASPLATIQGSKNFKIAAQNIASYLQEKGYLIEELVLGLPRHMNGSESERSEEVRKLKIELEQLGFQVTLFDERLTSVQADRILQDVSFTRKKRSQFVDRLAAVILLQSYLDGRKV
jgi:putative Holliday junction resolvase